MGVNNGGRTKWVAKGLTLKTLHALDAGKRIDVDGNALLYTFINKKSIKHKTVGKILKLMAQHLKQLAHSGGFVVTVIFDGSTRPDCKRASLQRRKEVFLDDANRMFCRFKSLELNAKYEKTKNVDDKEQLDEYNAECRKLEKKCGCPIILPDNIATLLSERLMMEEACSPNENGGYVDENVLTSVFQADSLIAKRSSSNQSDFIYGNDSDYFVWLGSKCLLIWGLWLMESSTTKDATQYQVELYGACNEHMNELKSKISQNTNNLPKQLEWREAEIPLFASPDATLRALIALSLGCDVFIGGIKNFGLKKVQEKIEKHSKDHNGSIVPYFKQDMIKLMKGLSNSEIDTLLAAFLYEPGIVDKTKKVPSYDSNENIDNEDLCEGYVHTPPDGYRFPSFLSTFEIRKNIVPSHEQQHDPLVCFCDGFNNNGRHKYLSFEGSNTCSNCKKTFCQTCSFIPSVDIPRPTKSKPRGRIYYQNDCQDIFCLDCFKSKRFGEEGESNDKFQASDISIDEMKKVLNERSGLQLSARDISPAEIMDLYEMYVSSPNNNRDVIHLANATKRIKYPVFASNCIDDESFFRPISSEFPFSEGGRFLSNPNTVSDENIPQVLDLFASLLTYDEGLIPKNDENNQSVYVGEYGF